MCQRSNVYQKLCFNVQGLGRKACPGSCVRIISMASKILKDITRNIEEQHIRTFSIKLIPSQHKRHEANTKNPPKRTTHTSAFPKISHPVSSDKLRILISGVRPIVLSIPSPIPSPRQLPSIPLPSLLRAIPRVRSWRLTTSPAALVLGAGRVAEGRQRRRKRRSRSG